MWTRNSNSNQQPLNNQLTTFIQAESTQMGFLCLFTLQGSLLAGWHGHLEVWNVNGASAPNLVGGSALHRSIFHKKSSLLSIPTTAID